MSDGRFPIEGGCFCGAIRFRVKGPIKGVVHCHCRMCQRSGGASHMTWVTLAKADFDLLQGRVTQFRSSEHGERGFCAACGTPLTFWSRHAAEDLDVTVGSFDHPEMFRPQRHIYVSSRLPWLRLDEGLPEHDTQSNGTESTN